MGGPGAGRVRRSVLHQRWRGLGEYHQQHHQKQRKRPPNGAVDPRSAVPGTRRGPEGQVAPPHRHTHSLAHSLVHSWAYL